jgi:pimeloyl-ACP methyl ester carboxylesterase
VSTFVLMPGAGSGPEHWTLVEPLLAAAGHVTVAPDLPCESDTDGLPEFTAAALEAIGDRAELILVGQSLGAFTAAAVATERDVELLVYLNGMIPIEGESPGEWWGNVGHAEAAEELFAKHGPMYTWTEPDFAAVFLHDVPPENAAVETPRQQGGGIFELPLASYPTGVPVRAIGGSNDRFFPIEFQKELALARIGIEVDEIDAGHAPALANPEALAAQLIAYADEI